MRTHEHEDTPACYVSSLQQYEKLRIEVEILRSLRHKNVVSYLGTSMDEGLVYIFMEFISGGSLQSILKRCSLTHCVSEALYS